MKLNFKLFLIQITNIQVKKVSHIVVILLLSQSFDQEAATVIMARLSVHKCKTEDSADVMRYLDRSLIKLCAKFANYRKDDPSSFRLPYEFHPL